MRGFLLKLAGIFHERNYTKNNSFAVEHTFVDNRYRIEAGGFVIPLRDDSKHSQFLDFEHILLVSIG